MVNWSSPVAALVCGLVVSGLACSPRPAYWSLPERERAALGGAERLLAVAPIHLAPAFELRLPSNSGTNSMASSVDISAGQVGGRCVIAVGDRVDRAVHLFDTGGSYVSTINGGGRDTSRFPALVQVGVNSGRVIATDGGTRTVWLYDPNGAGVSVRIPSPISPPPSRFRVVYDGSRLYEVWAAQNGKSSAHWDSLGIPLIRAVDLQGNTQGGYGALQHFSGLAISGALNVGALALRDDTLWFANFAQARVQGYSLRSISLTRPSRSVALPVFFLPRSPLELHGPGMDDAQALVEYQLQSFTVGPNGVFVMIQATSYPKYAPTGKSHRPSVVVSAAARDGQSLGAFDLGVRPIALAATATYWFAIVQDTVGSRTRVLAYHNPLASQVRMIGENASCH